MLSFPSSPLVKEGLRARDFNNDNKWGHLVHLAKLPPCCSLTQKHHHCAQKGEGGGRLCEERRAAAGGAAALTKVLSSIQLGAASDPRVGRGGVEES